MRKNRHFLDETMYHVTSRTNGKERIFDHRPGKAIMMRVLKQAKVKFGFRVANFCIMPTHIHLLITPKAGADLPEIIRWIKLSFTMRWHALKGTSGHVWGNRYFARPVNGNGDYLTVMDYIDKNPVKQGLVSCPEEWKESGAFHIHHKIPGFVD